MLRVAFHRIDKIRNEVETPLQHGVDLAPLRTHGLLQGNQLVIDRDEPADHQDHRKHPNGEHNSEKPSSWQSTSFWRMQMAVDSVHHLFDRG